MAAQVHVQDTVEYNLTITKADGTTAHDVSGATTKDLHFLGPHGQQETIALAFDSTNGNGTGTDGKVTATTLTTTFDVAGEWQLMVRFVEGAIDLAGTFTEDVFARIA